MQEGKEEVMLWIKRSGQLNFDLVRPARSGDVMHHGADPLRHLLELAYLSVNALRKGDVIFKKNGKQTSAKF